MPEPKPLLTPVDNSARRRLSRTRPAPSAGARWAVRIAVVILLVAIGIVARAAAPDRGLTARVGEPARAAALLAWYERERRPLPWRATRDPYALLVSEVMLQQTQAERVVPYYERFLARFPDPAALAAAPPRTVLAAWSGLGYNRRALALQAAARAVVAGRLAGRPHGAARRRALHRRRRGRVRLGRALAAVDANVRRVIERWDGRRRPPRALAARAAALLPAGRPADWNQAMMELGATVCTARAPRCAGCPVAPWCASAGAVAAPAPARRGSRPASRTPTAGRAAASSPRCSPATRCRRSPRSAAPACCPGSRATG